MLASFWTELDLSHWQVWAGPALGLASAGLMLLVGRALLFGRTSKETVDAAAPEDGASSGGKRGRERRGTDRRGGNQIAVLISNSNATADPLVGWVINRSNGGLRLSTDERVATTGMILSVRPRASLKETPWIQVEVRSCSQSNGYWDLHCKFVQTPPWGTLLLFG